ncbi:hypothetical protein [Brevundimonas sp. PWP3-1b1]|uniref:hypothetical protein n=1 Tax=unclassified Brevundimonas TaxID=2622653 RepID=UPI003CF6FC5E
MEVHNIAGEFLGFWDSTRDKTTAERVVLFKRDVAPEFPGFYGHARFNGLMTEEQRDGTIARSIESFGAIRDAYVLKLETFDRDLARNTSVFAETFPDFQPDRPIWVLHSLGEFDGGTRVIDGQAFLLFGVDGMVAFHDADVTNEAAFFHHELFHLYHRPRLGACEAIWCSLWQEGLATYVASKLNPAASEAELLLTLPDDMAAATRLQLEPSLLALRQVLTLKDPSAYSDLFGFGGPATSSLPQRRGYYLGFLVAEQLGRTHDLQTLANMPAEQAQPLVIEAVDQLIARARATP